MPLLLRSRTVVSGLVTSAALLMSQQAFAEIAPNISFEALAKTYVQNHRDEMAGSTALSTAYANRFLCQEYQKSSSNEFALPKLVAKAQDEIKALNVATTPLNARTYATFGSYDMAAGKFPFKPMDDKNNIFELTDDAIGNVGQLSPCAPRVTGWPRKFRIVIDNFDVVDGIPMTQDKAQALVESRAKLYAQDQRKLGVNFKLNFKDFSPVDENYVSTVKASIIGVTLDDGTVPPGWGKGKPAAVVYTYDDAYLAGRKAEVDKRLADEERERTTGPIAFSKPNIIQWYNVFINNAPRTMNDGTALRPMVVQTEFASHGNGDGVSVNALKPNTAFNNYIDGVGTVSTSIVNGEEFGRIINISPEVNAKLANNILNARARIIMTPVGGKLKTNQAPGQLYVHADKVIFDILEGGKVKEQFEVAAKSEATPYTPPAEPAPAVAAAAAAGKPDRVRGSVDYFTSR